MGNIENAAKKEFYKRQAETIIDKMKMRHMDAYYCENTECAKEKLIELLGSTPKNVGYGGSMTIDDNGFKNAVTGAGHNLIVRENYKTADEIKGSKALLINADAFLMSSNAITLDGELVNIDGRGSRLAFLLYGPEEVYVIAGMNKVTADVKSAIERVRNIASPPNCIRLGKNTPCAITGKCGECYNDSICSQIVVTRTSIAPGRIKVILIGEELGY